MYYTSLYPLMRAADRGQYAFGAFNVNAFVQVQAAIETHYTYHSAAILQGAELANGFFSGRPDYKNATMEDKAKGAKILADIVKAKAKEVPIPVVLHLDHGKSFEICKICIDAGYSSVMIDASSLPYEENVELTREVVKYAHERGVSVEAELGVLAGVEDDVQAQIHTYTNPLTALDFVHKTGVDALAISYGTSHGANKGKNVKLRKNIAIATRELFLHEEVETMLVSHGSSSVPQYLVRSINERGGHIQNAAGVPASELRPVIEEGGIAKINVDTDIRLAVTNNVRELFLTQPEWKEDPQGKAIWQVLTDKPEEFDPRVYAFPVIDMITTGEVTNTFEAALTDCFYRGTVEALGQNMAVFGQFGSAADVKSPSLDELAQMYRDKK
jgi:fructose-bisphosphate aldolase class II